MSEFRLALYEAHSDLWAKLRAELNTELARQRERNDGCHDPIETARIRGRIAQLKEILDFEPSESET